MSEEVVVNNILVDPEPRKRQFNIWQRYPFNIFDFKCRMSNFASARKTDLKNQNQNWCFICFSGYTSGDNLNNYFSSAHSKNQKDLDLALVEASR